MNSKDGSPGDVVAPAEPTVSEDADVADPGEIAEMKAQQQESGEGKYGSTPVDPHKPPETEQEKEEKPSWIEIELVDKDDHPIPGEAYKIVLPDESVKTGTLDQAGFARVEGIAPGTCQVTFPDMDGRSWETA